MNEVSQRTQYTEQDRRDAALNYLLYGTLTEVERRTGIPDSTVQGWKDTEWWQELTGQLKATVEDQFKARCIQIVDKSTEAILDRIENGNEVNTKDGIRNLKVSAGELAKVGGIFYDKLRISEGLPTNYSANTGSQKAIDDLANQFKALSNRFAKTVISDQSGKPELDDK